VNERLTVNVEQFALLQWAAAADKVPLGGFPISLGSLATLIGERLIETQERYLVLTDRGLRFLVLCIPNRDGGASCVTDSLPREGWFLNVADKTRSTQGMA
jgi:hypothetical protein